MRWFGLDVHRDFCEVAVVDEEGVRSAGRIATRMPTLELFAQSLGPGDVVALEATTGADRIVSVLEHHGIQVVVANTRKLRSITEAKAKTDRLDARALAQLLASGLLEEVWTPNERTRALRRLTNRRERLVRARTRAKNEAHGVLARTRSKKARRGPGVRVTFQATSPSICRVSEAPALEMWPWRAGPLPDWRTRGSSPR